MNYSNGVILNKNYSTTENRGWKSPSSFSRKSGTRATATGHHSSPIVVSSGNNNHMYGLIQSNHAGKTDPQSLVPEIQMINKFYGLVPRKFVICERVRPFTALPPRQRSAPRPKSTKESSPSPSSSSQSSSNSSGDKKHPSILRRTGNTENDEETMPSVTSRRMSFEKLYRRKPKRLVHQSKSLELQSFGDEGAPKKEEATPDSIQRVIRIDLNQIKWDEESVFDEGKSCEEDKLAKMSENGKTLRKTISFDENVLDKDEVPKKVSGRKMERPATAAAVSTKVLQSPPPPPPKNEVTSATTPVLTSTTTPHWTVGKSTAERRAKLQRSFSVKDSSIDGGGESESEVSKYPESLVYTGRKSLHVEVAPEVDTMISKMRNRNQKVQQEIPALNFELELSRLIIESEALLANPVVKLTKENSTTKLQMPAVPVNSSQDNFEEIPKISKTEPEPLQIVENSLIEINHEISGALKPVQETAKPVGNPLKLLSASERRKLLKKSTSLPNEKELSIVANNSTKTSRKSATGLPSPGILRRQSSLGGENSEGKAGVMRAVSSHSSANLQKPSRISIKKPLVEITRLRPKTAPTTNKQLRHQPLKGRSTHSQATTTILSKPLPQTKIPDSPKKLPSWTPRTESGRKMTDLKSTSSTTSVTTSTTSVVPGTRSAKSAKEIRFVTKPHSKDKCERPKVPEIGSDEEDDGEADGDGDEKPEVQVPKPSGLPRRSFSLDEGALLSYSTNLDDSFPINSALSLDPSLQSLKKREQCVQIYEKMMKVGCAVRLQTILKGMMTPTEYNNFIAAAERAAAAAEVAKEAAAAEKEKLELDAGVCTTVEDKLKSGINGLQSETEINLELLTTK